MMLFGLVSCVFWVPMLAVADIPGTTCPECGRSLLTEGVATRSLAGRRRSSMLQAQLAWLGVWGGLSVVVSWLVWWIWLMQVV